MSENYLIPDIAGEAYMHLSSGKGSTFGFVVSLTVTLKDSVLKAAVGDILKRLPQFSAGLDKKGYSFRKAEKPFPVFRTEDMNAEWEAGSDELAGYLFRISYRYKTIFLDFHRSLCDESGALVFIKALVFRYIQLSDLPVNNDGTVKTVNESFFDAEAGDSLSRLEDIQASRPIWYMDAKAFQLPAGNNGICYFTQVRIPLSKLKGDMCAFSGGPLNYVTPLFSHVLYEKNRGDVGAGEFVVASIKTNLRPYFPTATVRSFFTSLYLAYNRNITEYPFGTVVMSQKKLLEAQLKHDALAYSAQRLISDLEKISCGQAEDIMKKRTALSTYDICHIGNVMIPDSLKQYITEIYPVLPAALHSYSLSSIIFKGEMLIGISSSENDCDTGRRFVRLLNDNDIYSYVSDEFSYVPMKYVP